MANSTPYDRYHGFSLKSVCWGYRDLFARILDGLFEQGLIGPDRREVTTRLFDLLRHADQSSFDHVLKEFLSALNPRVQWMLSVPSVFEDVVDLGQELAQATLRHGHAYFATLGEGGFGDSPEQVRDLLTHMRRLRTIDDALAIALMKGYRQLADRMTPTELARYIDVGLDIHVRNPTAGQRFLAGTLATCEDYIVNLTHECRMVDVQDMLVHLLAALSGQEMDIHDLGALDSDDLLERGALVVCAAGGVYLPSRVRQFDSRNLNRCWYLLNAVVSGGMLAKDTFCRIHGHPDYATCADLVGQETWRVNLFQILEYARALRHLMHRWPGTIRLVQFGLKTEFAKAPPTSEADQMLADLIANDTPTSPAAQAMRDQAEASANCFHTAELLNGAWTETVLAAHPDLRSRALRAWSFLPDLMFPCKLSAGHSDSVVADLQRKARRASQHQQDDEKPAAATSTTGNDQADADTEEGTSGRACYLYDEWNQQDQAYLPQYCRLSEHIPTARETTPIPRDVIERGRQVSRLFEQFKPDLTRREKFLPDGETIDTGLLIDYIVQRRMEPSPRVNFYQKQRLSKRDLAVVILLDCSGSTDTAVGAGPRVLDVEKHAGLILGQGLAMLGDRFEICGFTSNGHEDCRYLVFKDFAQRWDRTAMHRVLAARAMNATRIGPALRHAGYRLQSIDARQRLIILVTDGKPMDSHYDPATRYAQYDVRMACMENQRKGIHSFGLSTEDNTTADMEIMFPRRRFIILSDIEQLPRLLVNLYLRLTV